MEFMHVAPSLMQLPQLCCCLLYGTARLVSGFGMFGGSSKRSTDIAGRRYGLQVVKWSP